MTKLHPISTKVMLSQAFVKAFANSKFRIKILSWAAENCFFRCLRSQEISKQKGESNKSKP